MDALLTPTPPAVGGDKVSSKLDQGRLEQLIGHVFGVRSESSSHQRAPQLIFPLAARKEEDPSHWDRFECVDEQEDISSSDSDSGCSSLSSIADSQVSSSTDAIAAPSICQRRRSNSNSSASLIECSASSSFAFISKQPRFPSPQPCQRPCPCRSSRLSADSKSDPSQRCSVCFSEEEEENTAATEQSCSMARCHHKSESSLSSIWLRLSPSPTADSFQSKRERCTSEPSRPPTPPFPHSPFKKRFLARFRREWIGGVGREESTALVDANGQNAAGLGSQAGGWTSSGASAGNSSRNAYSNGTARGGSEGGYPNGSSGGNGGAGGGGGNGGGQPPGKSHVVATTNGRNSPPVQSIFRRLELVGRGAYGAVYRGVHVATGQAVALKVVNLDTPEDDVQEIQHEVATLSHLKEASKYNVVQYWGCWMKSAELWIVMDYAEGGSVRTLVSRSFALCTSTLVGLMTSSLAWTDESGHHS